VAITMQVAMKNTREKAESLNLKSHLIQLTLILTLHSRIANCSNGNLFVEEKSIGQWTSAFSIYILQRQKALNLRFTLWKSLLVNLNLKIL
jgi:hypothetical protein